MDIKGKAEKLLTELVIGYINSLGADLTNRFLFGGGNDTQEVLDKVDELLRQNKLGEAQAAVSHLKGRMSTIGQTDEEMILQDLMEVERLGLAPNNKVREAVDYLAGVTPAQRRRIRKGNVAESNPIVRQNKWATFANADDDAARSAILNAAGFNDPTELERLQAWDQQHFGTNATIAEAEATVRVHQAGQAINGRRIKPRGWGWLNPFR
jgi:hypothetical protein